MHGDAGGGGRGFIRVDFGEVTGEVLVRSARPCGMRDGMILGSIKRGIALGRALLAQRGC